MEKINFNDWQEITREEHRDLEEEETMWIMFHKDVDYIKGYFFKKKQ